MTQHHHTEDAHATADTPGATYDPVCGHWVDPAKAHGVSSSRLGAVHFCSVHCKRAFDREPERFLARYEARPQAHATALRHGATSGSRMGFLDKIRSSATPATATDPVCHMRVDPQRAGGKSEHEGETYWFCSGGCKERFDAEPAKYLSPENKGGMH